MVSLHEPGSRRAVGGIAAALSHRGGELTVLRLQDAGRLEVARRDRRQRWAAWQDLPNDEPLAVSSGVAAVDIGRGAIVVPRGR